MLVLCGPSWDRPNRDTVRVRNDPMAVIERLFDDGSLYWLATDSDGGYAWASASANACQAKWPDSSDPRGWPNE
jgi:hypothetical protein